MCIAIKMCDVDTLSLNYQQLLAEISTLLETTADSSDANALILNQELQRRLEQVRKCMTEILELVRARYQRNEEVLVRRIKPRSHNDRVPESIGESGAILRGGTFFFKGNLYFRDEDGRSCPNNEDYKSRCATEMFPTDFDMRSKHVWTVLDKKNIVMGIKQQLLDHVHYRKLSNSGKRKAIDLHVNTLASMLNSVDSSFTIDWNQISTLDLESRHSSYSCEAMWLVYLHPKLKRDDWSAQEDDALIEGARVNKQQNWQAIADAVHQRSDYQCFVRLHTALRFSLEATSSFKWGSEDNERLRKIVSRNTKNGVVNWSQVVEHFPGRNRSTIIGRYMYVLHPSISHAPFTPKEDLMLFAAYEDYNGKFNCFPRTLFPNRSLAQLRTRYHNVLAQRTKTDSWSVGDDEKLMEFTKNQGTSQWVNCAKYLGNHTRTSCRTRFLTINRFLEQHPNASVADIPRRKITKNVHVTTENFNQRLQEWQEDPDSLLYTNLAREKPKNNSIKKFKQEPLNYVEALRGMDRRIYEYFKYAYNLNLRSPAAAIVLPREACNLNVVANAMKFRPPDTASQIIQSVSLSKQLNRCYNKMLLQLPAPNNTESIPMNQMLQPNWSTMMGFRTICILSGHCEKHGFDQQPINYDESHTAVQLFRQRFRALFFRTTLLSRLEAPTFGHFPEALMELPRPAANYSLHETARLSIKHNAVKPRGPFRKNDPITARQVASMQIEELGRLRSLKSEPTECMVEQNFKQELPFE